MTTSALHITRLPDKDAIVFSQAKQTAQVTAMYGTQRRTIVLPSFSLRREILRRFEYPNGQSVRSIHLCMRSVSEKQIEDTLRFELYGHIRSKGATAL